MSFKGVPSWLVAGLLCGVCGSLAMRGQGAAETAPAAFDVATVKSNPTEGGWRLQFTPDGFDATRVSLLMLIQDAYGIYDNKMISGGPAWVDVDKFDVEAKFDVEGAQTLKPMSQKQQQRLLQGLLEERFGLKLHEAMREFPVFDMIVAKSGSKLMETPAAERHFSPSVLCFVLKSRPGYVKAQDCTMEALAGSLRYSTGRTVVDRTGLEGRYNYELRWTPENAPADAVSVGPGIFSAVEQQLGLKLVRGKTELETLVIDAAEKPSAN